MHYLGGKFRIAKRIASFLELIAKHSFEGDATYIEPFVGGANILTAVNFKSRIASDYNASLVHMYRALQLGWVPPDNVSYEEYAWYKKNGEIFDPLTAFIGIGCSFSGKWFGGYARSDGRNYALNAKNSLLKIKKGIEDVRLVAGSYDTFNPKQALIYCDPPYNNTTGYSGVPKFDHCSFYRTVRHWTSSNVIVVSEYEMPSDFDCVLEIETKTDMRVRGGMKENRTEKLFMHNSQSWLALL